ncbi:MAG: methyltransferase [Bryobacteraceae bacterium]
MNLPNPAGVLDLIDAFRRSKTMFTALRLGVFDRLEAAPASAEALARRIKQVDKESLERLLDACTGLGLLLKDGVTYENSAEARTYLCRASPHSLAGYILYSDQVLYPMWSHLDDAVREGGNRWRQTFGLEGPIFNHFFRDEEAMRTFILGMHGLGMLSSPAVAGAFDLSRFQRIADLGGATGHLVAAVCEKYPATHGVLFELPQVVAFAREVLAQSTARDRIDLVAGDFFTDDLPAADLYALGRILHDWSEQKISRLLSRIFDALPPGGGLLIAEKLLNETKTGPPPAHLQSLNMLICTEGKERSLAEYRSLLERHGFTSVEGAVTGAPLDVVLALKP